jgi:hypothetical protein
MIVVWLGLGLVAVGLLALTLWMGPRGPKGPS